jgi:uncharacterized membrane protein YeaQ/YmgE (transglycosylase-associated protein family)
MTSMFIVWLLIIGLIAGALARLLVPGKDPMGIVGTIVLGVVGSLVGGFLANLLFNKDDRLNLSFAGLIGSVIGAVIVLLVWRAVSGRSRTHV